jgi:enolase
MFNILNGGAYAKWQGTDLQKIMIAPAGAPSYTEALRWGDEVYHALKNILGRGGYSTSTSDEGSFTPLLKRNGDALDLIVKAIEKAGYRPGEDIVIAIDTAASDFYENGLYHLHTEDQKLDAEEMVAMYAEWVKQYPIAVLEDGLAEDDWDGWKRLGSELGKKIELVGDDLFATNVGRIRRGIKENVANAVLINLNQIGSISEAIEAVQLAYEGGWGVMVSHRGSEMVDSFIADFTVAFGTGQIKAGAPACGKLFEKYNQLLSIDEYLGESAVYAGHKAFMQGK